MLEQIESHLVPLVGSSVSFLYDKLFKLGSFGFDHDGSMHLRSAISADNASQKRKLPECWGHRGASAAWPENTLASFEAAIAEGSEGIESDVHISLDDVIVMFHDPTLDRTTNSTGNVKDRKWFGPDGMEHVRTTKQPAQPIPTLPEVVALLMSPDNQHIKFNIDVKVFNDPARLFPLMHSVISAYPEWETKLAPRIILGLWHPRFIEPAKKWVPYCTRSHIGFSLDIARKWFWEDCESFSINFMVLATPDGEKFREECRAAGKQVLTWTVNDPEHMMEAFRWNVVDAIMTDVPKVWLDLRSALSNDYAQVATHYKRTFLWTNPLFYPRVQSVFIKPRIRLLEQVGGPLDPKLPINRNSLNPTATLETSGSLVYRMVSGLVGVVRSFFKKGRIGT